MVGNMLQSPSRNLRSNNSIEICHESDTGWHTLVVDKSAAQAFIRRGDLEGPCENFCFRDVDCNDNDPCTENECQADHTCVTYDRCSSPGLQICIPHDIASDTFDCVECNDDSQCDDGDPCTADSCFASTCVNEARCSDPMYNICIPVDAEIDAYECVQCETSADCDDLDACTLDTCLPDHTCLNDNRCADSILHRCIADNADGSYECVECMDAFECQGDDLCMNYACENGLCISNPKSCQDGYICSQATGECVATGPCPPVLPEGGPRDAPSGLVQVTFRKSAGAAYTNVDARLAPLDAVPGATFSSYPLQFFQMDTETQERTVHVKAGQYKLEGYIYYGGDPTFNSAYFPQDFWGGHRVQLSGDVTFLIDFDATTSTASISSDNCDLSSRDVFCDGTALSQVNYKTLRLVKDLESDIVDERVLVTLMSTEEVYGRSEVWVPVLLEAGRNSLELFVPDSTLSYSLYIQLWPEPENPTSYGISYGETHMPAITFTDNSAYEIRMTHYKGTSDQDPAWGEACYVAPQAYECCTSLRSNCYFYCDW